MASGSSIKWSLSIAFRIIFALLRQSNSSPRAALCEILAAYSGWVIHNYNRETVHIDLSTERLENGMIEDKFSGKQVKILGGQINMKIPPRSRLWLEIGNL